MQRTGRLFDDRAVVAGDYSGFCQDKYGFIWIATNRGLLRFDGNSYDVYRHEDAVPGSLSDSRILGVLCDSKGRLWVATANGLNLYHPSEDIFEVIPIPSKDFYGYIIGIDEQADGTVTFLVSGVGLYIIDDNEDGKFPVAVKYMTQTYEKDFNSIACSRSGKIYLGSRDGTVYCMARNGSLSRINVSDGSYIVSLAIEEDDNVLACTLTEIYRIDAVSGSSRVLSTEGKIIISSLSNQAGGKIYVATQGQGLWYVSTKSEIAEPSTDIYSPFLNISAAKIGAAYAAPDGNLWLGCNYQGVVMVPGRNISFLYRKLSDSYPDFGGGMRAMSLWKGNVIACLDKGRVAIFSPEGKLLRSAVIPEGGSITHIELLGNDTALVSVADNGIWQIDLNSGTVRKFLDIPGKYPSVVTAPGKEGELFVGVHGAGLLRYNIHTGEKTWIPFDPDGNKLTNPYITCLNRTDDGKVWIGLYGGIACYDLNSDSLLEINQEPFLKGATFAIVPCLTDSSVWVGTSHGLIHLDPTKGVLKKFTTADGLSDNDIRSITRDHKGGKWIGTMRGLSYLPADNDTLLSYYGGNGLVESSFNIVRFSPEQKRVFLGSDLGITSFMPDSVPAPGFDRNLKISAMYLNGKRMAPDGNSDKWKVVTAIDGKPVTIYLPYKENTLTLRMSTMDYRDGSNVRYIWRLNKKDAWIQGAPGDNTINLPHLDPGEYDLEICALENNVASDPKKVRIIISTPWYWSCWAKMAYIVIFLALVTLGLMVYKKKKDEEVNEDKIKFFMDVSHDIRSPMTLIMSPLESLMKKGLEPEVDSKLRVMHRNAQRVMNLMNQLLDIRKLDKGKMRLSCRKTDVPVFVKELVDIFQPQAEEKNLTLNFDYSGEPIEAWLDRDNFDKILVNLISNAIKYTPEGGSIDLALEKVEDDKLGECFRVDVMDSGIGLDPKMISRLFEPFYRVREDHAPATMGTGIGLDLCRRLVELHHGKISGANREDGVKGSVFSVIIPFDPARYGEEELNATAVAEYVPGQGQHLMMSGVAKSNEASSRRKPLSAGKKILIVDDDVDLRGYLAASLGNDYKVREAKDGNEALQIVSDWYPDIVISDVMMPGMDGLTLLKRLKSNSETNHIPVILLSSKTALADRMAAWDKGADGYLGKPFNIDELEALVDTLVENRQRMRGKFSGAQDTEGKIEEIEVKGNDEVLLERIMREINAHIDDPDLNVEKLSSEVGVSRAHLHRKMKDLIGMTPSDYMRNIRLKRACELLKRPDIEVTQVAYKIGFTSQPHFSSHFKRYTGFSPSEYRAKCLSGSDPGIDKKFDK
ncbi:MAG: response regulator [Muribaculaceae bacterium]|nr:response regulator [Muribaculaceae bacterium]